MVYSTAADPKFSVCGGSSVIGKTHRQSASLTHPIANGEIVPTRQVGRSKKPAGRNVHCARRSQPHATDIPRLHAGLSHCVEHCPTHATSPLSGAIFHVGRHGEPTQRPAEIIHHAHLN